MAEPLVFLPPMLCDGRVFAPQIAELSRERAVTVAPVNASQRVEEVASSLLDILPPKFALAGMGYGGIVAMELVRRAPKRVTRLALMDTSPLAETPHQASDREPQIMAAKTGRFENVIGQVLGQDILADTPEKPRIAATLREMARALGADVFVAQARAMQRRKDQTAALMKLEQPVLVLCGADDPVMPVKRHEVMAELISNATLVAVPDAGHLPTLEQPNAVTDALRDWLGSALVLR